MGPDNKTENKQIFLGHVKPRMITEEMETSYLEYAMSIIISRALPDVRDGLKPSQRRILYAMHSLGLDHQTKFRKSALVVGDVLGKYHPHGDMAVYETLVRMAQDFSLRYPLVKGQGNFGSIDGDRPAQMRYTECKLAKISKEMLWEIEKDTVNFIPNYDSSRKEPQVLPARIPQLLINGAMGIAVGMATNIPPHNVGEIIDALLFLIKNPNCGIEDLLNYVKGPDFPTGGLIYSKRDLAEAYSTGRGRIITRAKCIIEEEKEGKFTIIVKEITYQSNKATTIAKIADLVKQGKIKGIKDLRDESNKEGVRIVIGLKKDVPPQKILNRLYQLTDLQKNFGFNMLALEGGIQPKILNLKEILELFLEYRIEVMTRKVKFELELARARAHILEGLKKAIDIIDAIISTIRASKTKTIAQMSLIKKFKFTIKQAQAILEMKLQSLAGLEIKKIRDELLEKRKMIKEYEILLQSKDNILKIIEKDFRELKEIYADERRTKIISKSVDAFRDEDLIPEEEAIIMISKGGYVKRINPDTYKVQKRGGVGIIGASTKEDDFIFHIFTANTHDDVYFFTETGKVYVTKAYEISESNRLSKGQAIANFLSLSQKERITAVLPISSKKKPRFLFMATKKGRVKKVAIESFSHLRKNGMNAIKLNDKDELLWVRTTNGEDDIFLITKKGQAIRFKEGNVRPMGRTAAGVKGIRLKNEDQLVGMSTVPVDSAEGKKLLVITRKGYGKKTAIKNYKIQNRGGSGIKTMKITSKNGEITHASIVCEENENDSDIIATSSHGNIIRTKIKDISELGRATQGVRVMRLREGDELAQATRV